MYCVFHHISGHLPRQIFFGKILTKTWASVRLPRPLLGQMPNFFRKCILRAPLSAKYQNTKYYGEESRGKGKHLTLLKNILQLRLFSNGLKCHGIFDQNNEHSRLIFASRLRISNKISPKDYKTALCNDTREKI